MSFFNSPKVAQGGNTASNANPEDCSAASEDPPYSRLFVLYGQQGISNDELHEEFSKCGEIENIRFVEDKSGNPRGIAYIKYKKTSAAMIALEKLNDKKIKSYPKTIHVNIANKKGGDNTYIDPKNLSTLFVAATMEKNEEEVQDYFSQFGEIERINTLKTKPEDKRRLFYVVFTKAQYAAKALEDRSRPDGYMRVVIARPKQQTPNSNSDSNTQSTAKSSSGPAFSKEMISRLLAARGNLNQATTMQMGMAQPVLPLMQPQAQFMPLMGPCQDNRATPQTIFICCSSRITEGNLHRLLDIAPGLEDVAFLKQNEQNTEYYATYNSHANARNAMLKFNGLECPPGEYFYAEFKKDRPMGAPMGNAGFDRPMINAGFDRPMSNASFDRPMGNTNFDRPTNSVGFKRPTSSVGYDRQMGIGLDDYDDDGSAPWKRHDSRGQARGSLHSQSEEDFEDSTEDYASSFGRNAHKKKPLIGDNPYEQISELTEALQRAKKLLSTSGLDSEHSDSKEDNSHPIGNKSGSPYCSFYLPPAQPLVPRSDDGNGLRLFVVCHPSAPPVSVLNDVFCRFGNYCGTRILQNKNFGYAYFTCARSGLDALETLNEKTIAGKQISVVIADPERGSSDGRGNGDGEYSASKSKNDSRRSNKRY